MTNKDIVTLLRNVAAAYTITNVNRFKIIAYENAADSLEHLTSEVEDLWRQGKLKDIPGIGSSIASHLSELFETGKSKHFEMVLKEIPPAVYPLLVLPGFGAKRAYKLVRELKLGNPATALDDMKKAAEDGQIAKIEGFGEKSQNLILSSLSEYRKVGHKEKRMPLPYAHTLAMEIVEYIKQNEAVANIETLGSLRRMAATIGDIDIAVATNDGESVIDWFQQFPKISKVIERGKGGTSVVLGGGQHVDLRVIRPLAWGAMLQYFTGSKNHNIRLRELALKKNLSLNEYGIKNLKTETVRGFATEKDFYNFLGLAYIEPEIREDRGEIEAAQNNKLPKLVNQKDVRGDLQIHSNFPIEPSHDLGKNSMEEILDKAKTLGYEYIAFTEHNPSISQHTNSQIVNIMKKRYDKIEQLKSSTKSVRILNLLEIDIAADGTLAYPEEAFQYIDAALVSIHSSFNQPKEQMTKRVLNGLSHPKAKILAHPTGRLINRRTGIALDFDQIFEYAAKHQKAIEINSYPDRLDLPDALVYEARKYDVKFTLGTDSHDVSGMDLMYYGVSVARRGWLEADDIWNTKSYNELYNWLSS